FDLAAVVAVGPGDDRGAVVDLLGRLTAKSLVMRWRGPEARWRLLETVRAFALDELRANGEADEVRRRHLLWAEATASRLAPHEFDLVVDDLREALANCPEGVDALAHRLARALGQLTYARRFLEESIAHFRRAAALAPDPAEAAADLRRAAACTLMITNLGRQALPILVEAADRSREGGDGEGEAMALGRAVEVIVRYSGGLPVEMPARQRRELLARAESVEGGGGGAAQVGAQLAIAAAWDRTGQRHDPDPELAERALAAARSTGDPLLIGAALDLMSTVETSAGRLALAHRLSDERAQGLERLDRDDPRTGAEIVDCLHMRAVYAIAAGDLPAALEAGWAARRDDLIGKHPYSAASKLVIALALAGEVEATLAHSDEMHSAWSREGSPAAPWMAAGLLSAALAAGMSGDAERSRWWRERALVAAGSADAPAYASFAAFVDARVALHIGESPESYVDRAFAEFPHGRNRSYAQAAGAELAVAAGLASAPELIAAARPVVLENRWATACLTRAEARLSGDEAGLAAAAGMWEALGARGEHALTLLLLPGRAAQGLQMAAGLGITVPS
ncbi:MAG TPA: hypothetical protein VF062_15635, partial [Candidatus Limnocylindrales bacterium]